MEFEMNLSEREIDFEKNPDGLLPAIVQDARTGVVLMQAYMNAEAFMTTLKTKKVTFYSRSKQRLWMKGESSGNTLSLVEVKVDCDGDSILIKAIPAGPACHTGSDSCWNETNEVRYGFLSQLEAVIEQRRKSGDTDGSYVAKLFERGINTIAQKVGEEAVELVIEAKDNDDEQFKNEAADLLFHYLVLLKAKGFSLDDIAEVLESRH